MKTISPKHIVSVIPEGKEKPELMEARRLVVGDKLVTLTKSPSTIVSLTKGTKKSKNQNKELWSDKTTECDWDDATKFADQLNREKHLGRANWRVPKLWELLKAYDLKIEGFEEVSWYWSSSGNVSYSVDAWNVGFDNGNANSSNKSYDIHVRCVASGTE